MNNYLNSFYAKMLNKYEADAFAAYNDRDLNLYHVWKESGRSLIADLRREGYTVTYDEANETYIVSK